MQTQRETIIQLLNAAEWVCGTTFLQNYLQEYRSRINELRRDGFTIEARRCTRDPHRGMMQEWSLKLKGSVAQQNAPGQDFQALPTQVYQPVYEPKKKTQPYVWQAPMQCCQVAIACQERRLPIQHSQKCSGEQVAIK
jgi:hypothetical protein